MIAPLLYDQFAELGIEDACPRLLELERLPTGDVLSTVVSGRLGGPEQQTRSVSGYIEPMSLIEEVRRTRRAEAEKRGDA